MNQKLTTVLKSLEIIRYWHSRGQHTDWSNDAIHQNHERAHVLGTLARDTHVHTYIERLGDVVVVADVGERTTEELAGGRWVRRRLALALLEETQRRLLRLQRFLLLIFVCKKSIKTKR